MGKCLENNLLNLIENWWWMSCLWTTFTVTEYEYFSIPLNGFCLVRVMKSKIRVNLHFPATSQ